MTPGFSAIRHVEAVFGDGPEATIAKSLVAHLESHHGTNHITLGLMRQISPPVKTGNIDVAILRTLQFLAGDEVRFLEHGFELVVDENTVTEISSDEFRIALSEHIDPLTGHRDSEIERRLLIYFIPTPSLENNGGAP